MVFVILLDGSAMVPFQSSFRNQFVDDLGHHLQLLLDYGCGITKCQAKEGSTYCGSIGKLSQFSEEAQS